MRISITTDDGELLDWVTITRADYDREVEWNPHSIVAGFDIGDAL